LQLDRRPSLRPVLLDPAAFFMTLGTYEGSPIMFDTWQVRWLHDFSRFRAAEKAPQIGFSWVEAASYLWESLLFEHSTTSFVSVDEREAQEKILYGRKLYEGLPAVVQSAVPLVADSTEKLVFGHLAAPSRLLSIPATSALRGRATNVVMDECDFYRDGGQQTFRVALGRVTREKRRLDMGSTCWGVDTKLDQVMQGEDRNFSRYRFAHTVAENEDIRESVEIARSELTPEEFDEEYGAVRGAGGKLEFTPELLRSAMHDEGAISWTELDPRARLVGAYDVGGGQHPSMLTIFEKRGTWDQRVLEEIREPSLVRQGDRLDEIMRELPSLVLVIDRKGIGQEMAERLQSKWGRRRVLWMQPSGGKNDEQNTSEMVTRCKLALEEATIRILSDREQSLQFRRTTKTKEGRVEQPGSRRRTHYDRFWTVAYATWGITSGARHSGYHERGLIVIGGR
jgi:phage FluMu gp28-like protein